jgi:hypothetical protein
LEFTTCGTSPLGNKFSSSITNSDLYRVSKKEGLQFLCESNAVTFVFFQNLSLAFNFCLCHDLIQTLKDPFYPGKRRMTRYFYGSILVAAILSAVSKKELASKCHQSNNLEPIVESKWYYS